MPVADLSSFSLVLFCGELECCILPLGKLALREVISQLKHFVVTAVQKQLIHTLVDHFFPKEAPHNKLLPVGITSEPSSLPPAGSAEEGGRVGKY